MKQEASSSKQGQYLFVERDTEDAEGTFIQTGQRILKERVQKLLDWRDEALKHEDIEAVHKMRVATRRLRAALDAFEMCYKPRQFKRMYRSAKAMANALGAVRDMDVMLQNLQATCTQVADEERAGVQWLIDRLSTYRQHKQQELEVFFEKFDEDTLRID